MQWPNLSTTQPGERCMQVKSLSKQLIRDAGGATAVEYGVILMLIALVLLAGLNSLGGSVLATWTDVADKAAN